jgi:hypothetical protein
VGFAVAEAWFTLVWGQYCCGEAGVGLMSAFVIVAVGAGSLGLCSVLASAASWWTGPAVLLLLLRANVPVVVVVAVPFRLRVWL